MKSINKFFTQDFDVWRLQEVREFGRVKEDFTLLGSYKGRFDRNTSGREIIADKKTYTISDNLYCEVIDVKFGDKIIKGDGSQYLVISINNPFDKSNHLELGLERVI